MTNNFGQVKSVKADRRRRAYRKRLDKHLALLRVPPSERRGWSGRRWL